MPHRLEPQRVSAALAEQTGCDRFDIDIGTYNRVHVHGAWTVAGGVDRVDGRRLFQELGGLEPVEEGFGVLGFERVQAGGEGGRDATS